MVTIFATLANMPGNKLVHLDKSHSKASSKFSLLSDTVRAYL